MITKISVIQQNNDIYNVKTFSTKMMSEKIFEDNFISFDSENIQWNPNNFINNKKVGIVYLQINLSFRYLEC